MAESASVTARNFSARSASQSQASSAPAGPLPLNFRQLKPLIEALHRELGIKGPSTSLTRAQLDSVFQWAGKRLGVRPVLLQYIASTESSFTQKQPPDSPAAGIMQIEKAAHPSATKGQFNVVNDTIANVLYGAWERARIDRRLDFEFEGQGLVPPTNTVVRELLGDFAYNRGPELLAYIPELARRQGININNIHEYLAGRGGRAHLQTGWGGHVHIVPAPGSSVSPSGRGSVLDLALSAVDANGGGKPLRREFQDRNCDGVGDRRDILVLRNFKYVKYMAQYAPTAK